ncbi:pentatricopeptide repeat-containing protein [Forsythia ovata]|uniref:Pentatricopeptide repeat-containing protein n=1 Tax=Forsythia ovata TaxID=205694 RepID=A0ABD1SHQ2_9LAMI
MHGSPLSLQIDGPSETNSSHAFLSWAPLEHRHLHKIMAFTTATTNLSQTERIFDHIENPTLFIYNVMIKAYVKKGSYKKAIFLFDELHVHGSWPDNYTYPFVFKAVERLGELDLGERIHGFVIKSGLLFDSYVCNSVMDMYGGLRYVQS